MNLVVRPGEKVAIIGANGTGKSTLLHLLDGLVFPDHGDVLAFGEPLREVSLCEVEAAHRFRRRVGLVFQNADIQLFCPSVREDIAFGPLQLGVDEEEVLHRLDAVAGILAIGHLLDRVPHQLSIGEKRRVAIASVLAIDPEVYLFDEPTAGLDPSTVRQVIDFILKANKRGKTIITATHDLHIAGEIADTVHVFGRNRRIERSGTPESVLSDTAFLEKHNLVHSHQHRHDGSSHTHTHRPTELHG
ncbi:energy-coupling factor ABC transporter ATP-binding protein [Pelodictyon luteolum]|uniref:energy-coupling factor ABC transporter ATP-binding protein n=1 Tax=Pelodictyon luteolum TaxID=1100 RepID=UPI003B831830